MSNQEETEMLDNYDFSGGVRGKYAQRYKEGTNLVRLDDDVIAMFPKAEEINAILRSLGAIIRQHEVASVAQTQQ
jgi:hypothetical protein